MTKGGEKMNAEPTPTPLPELNEFASNLGHTVLTVVVIGLIIVLLLLLVRRR